MTILPHTLRHATHNPETTGVDVKVLCELHESLNGAECRAVKPWYIAEMLNVTRQAVQQSLTRLVELGYLERGDKNGNGFTFRLTLPQQRPKTPPPRGDSAFAA